MMRILFIAHYFPPIGGAGVQRSAKFVKHLPSLGILPVVLTGEGKLGNRWTPEDQSLQSDIPDEVPVVRVTVPGVDGLKKEQRIRRKHAAFVEAGSKAIVEHQLKLIFVTMSPFEDAMIAAELSRRHGIPWVADLRDPWALDEFQTYRTFFHRWTELTRMKRSLESASSIIMNTPESMSRFRSAFPELKDRARVSITNGYDCEDFPVGERREKNRYFTVVHSGYLHTESGLRQQENLLVYRLLGKMASGVRILPRSHFYLIKALEAWRKSEPETVQRIRVQLIGVPSRVDEEIIKSCSVADIVEFTGYIPHADCSRRVQSADLLFLPMHSLPPGRRSTIVPGKTYEYMATHRRILAALPEGDARDFVAASGLAYLSDPDDVAGILTGLKAAFADWDSGRDASEGRVGKAVDRFERKLLTMQLARELERVLASSYGKTSAKLPVEREAAR